MKPSLYDADARRRTVSLTLNADLCAKAKQAGINLSRVAEEALAKALALRIAERMQAEIRRDLAAHDAFARSTARSPKWRASTMPPPMAIRQFDVLDNPVPRARAALPLVVILQSDFAETGRERVVAPLTQRSRFAFAGDGSAARRRQSGGSPRANCDRPRLPVHGGLGGRRLGGRGRILGLSGRPQLLILARRCSPRWRSPGRSAAGLHLAVEGLHSAL